MNASRERLKFFFAGHRVGVLLCAAIFALLPWGAASAGTVATGSSSPVAFSAEIEKENAASTSPWGEVLDRYAAGTLPSVGMHAVSAHTPPVLALCGASELPVKISKRVLDKIVFDKHAVPVEELRKLPAEIEDPIAVFASATRADSLVVLTGMKDSANGENAIVALALGVESGREVAEINAVSSVYGRPPDQILSFMRRGLLLYANAKKLRAYARENALTLPREASASRNKKLLTEADLARAKKKSRER